MVTSRTPPRHSKLVLRVTGYGDVVFAWLSSSPCAACDVWAHRRGGIKESPPIEPRGICSETRDRRHAFLLFALKRPAPLEPRRDPASTVRVRRAVNPSHQPHPRNFSPGAPLAHSHTPLTALLNTPHTPLIHPSYTPPRSPHAPLISHHPSHTRPIHHQAAAAAEKEIQKAAKAAEIAAAQGAAAGPDPLADRYGDAPMVQSVERSGRVWTHVKAGRCSLTPPACSQAKCLQAGGGTRGEVWRFCSGTPVRYEQTVRKRVASRGRRMRRMFMGTPVPKNDKLLSTFASDVNLRRYAQDVDHKKVYQSVTLRGRVHHVRGKGKSAFLVLRQQTASIQVIFFVDDVKVSKGMVKFVSNLPKESVVDISGLITKPDEAGHGRCRDTHSP